MSNYNFCTWHAENPNIGLKLFFIKGKEIFANTCKVSFQIQEDDG